MNAEKLKKLILSLTQDIEFEYLGVQGCICPFQRDNISVAYGDMTKDYTDVDEMMNDPIFSGKSLTEVCGQIEL